MWVNYIPLAKTLVLWKLLHNKIASNNDAQFKGVHVYFMQLIVREYSTYTF